MADQYPYVANFEYANGGGNQPNRRLRFTLAEDGTITIQNESIDGEIVQPVDSALAFVELHHLNAIAHGIHQQTIPLNDHEQAQKRAILYTINTGGRYIQIENANGAIARITIAALP